MTFLDTQLASLSSRAALALGALLVAVGCGDAAKPTANGTGYFPATGNQSDGSVEDPYAPGTPTTPTTPNYPYTPEPTTPEIDAGTGSESTPNSPSNTSDAGTPSIPNLFGDGGLGSLFPPSGSGSGSQSSGSDGGTPTECQNAVCVDVFDCYLWHPDKTSCGFTSCDLGTCK